MIAPLFIKTENSLLSSLIKIDDLINYAIKNDIKALTITDNNMYGVLEFYIKCIENNIKPIVGLNIFDIVLYATNYNGYKNLIKLTTINSKQKIDIDVLKKYSSDLICIIPYEYIDKYESLKFYENIYIGYKNIDEKNKIKIKKVYLKEILYLNKEDSIYMKYLHSIKTGLPFKSIAKNYDNSILDYKNYIDENVDQIVSLCNLEIPFNEDLLPVYDEDIDAKKLLKQKVLQGAKKIFGSSINKIYQDRLKYEIEVINNMGFSNYFLVVADYVNYAKTSGIMVGPGRGSAAGSLVSYLLGITTIDPIKYNLLFERFLNKDRISMPDIDVDFEDTRRMDVIKYCMNKYGILKVAPIITFGTLSSKQVISDVGKSLEIDSSIIDKLCKLVSSKESLNNISDKAKKYINDYNLKMLYEACKKLEGLKRHTSIHAAGVVMSKYPLDEIIPLEYHDSFYTTGYSMEYLEKLGLLKMDFLALKNLNLLNNILKELNINFDEIPLDDDKTLEIFRNVDTLGVFQFESNGMLETLKKFKINSFEDIVALLALYRPGPMQNIDSYIRRKNNKEKIDYIVDDLKDILRPTYGIIIYQEQIMQIALKMASYTLSEADLLRKAMSKRREDILLNEKEKFISQSVKNGYSLSDANKVYDLIFKFASFGFNRAHSVSYAMIAYKMAYLKAHYYDVFMKNLLSSVVDSSVKTSEYIKTCKNKLDILKPDINYSDTTYKIINSKLVYPLTCIKGVGAAIANIIINERNKSKFIDIYDFYKRCYNSIGTNIISNLNKAGCFKSFINEQTLDKNMDLLINYSDIGSLLEEELKPKLDSYPEYSNEELLQRENEVLGFYLSDYPTIDYKNNSHINLNEVNKYFNKNVKCVVYIEKIKVVNTKNNDKMVFVVGSDETDTLDFVIFNKNAELSLNSIYEIIGKVEKRYDKYQIVITNFRRLK